MYGQSSSRSATGVCVLRDMRKIKEMYFFLGLNVLNVFHRLLSHNNLLSNGDNWGTPNATRACQWLRAVMRGPMILVNMPAAVAG